MDPISHEFLTELRISPRFRYAGKTLVFLPWLLEPRPVLRKSLPILLRPIASNPRCWNSANGTPTVNIQTPSAAGVSRNTYQQFDIGARGAILNNSRSDVQTQIGGWVQATPVGKGSAIIAISQFSGSISARWGRWKSLASERMSSLPTLRAWSLMVCRLSMRQQASP